MTVAQLGFAIDSSDAAGAAADLDKLTSSATRAEQAAQRTGAAGSRMSRGFADLNPALEKIIGSLGRLEGIATSIDKRLDAMTSAATRAAKGNAVLEQSAIEASTAYKALQANLTAVTAAQSKADAAHGKSLAQIEKQREAIARLNAELQKLRSAPPAVPGGGRPRPANNNGQSGVGNIAAQLFDTFSTAPYMSSYQVGFQQGPQFAQAFAGQSAKQALTGLGAGLAAIASPVSLIAIGLTTAAAAAVQFGSSLFDSGNKAAEVLERHEAALARIKDLFDRAGEAGSQYGQRVQSAVDFTQRQDRRRLEDQLRDQLAEVRRQLSLGPRTPTPAYNQTYGQLGGLALQAAQGSIRTAEDLRRFNEEYQRIANNDGANKKLQESAARFDEITKSATATADAIRDLTSEVDKNTMVTTRMQAAVNAARYAADTDYARLSMTRRYDAEIAGIGARSPAERAAAERRRLEAEPIDPKEAPANRNLRIDQQVELVTRRAQQQLADAQRDRAINLDKIVQDQQQEIDLIGKTGGAAAALRKEYELTSQLRLDAARQGIEVDQKELDLIKERSAELGRLTDLYNQRRFNFDMGQQAGDARMSARDRQIVTTLRSYGLPEDLSGDNAARIGQQLDWQQAKDLAKGFGSTFGSELLSTSGDIGKSFANALKSSLEKETQKLWDRVFDGLGNVFADWLTGNKGGNAGSGGAVGSIAAAITGKAANDNTSGAYSGLAGAIPVTRSSLPDISATGDIASYIRNAAVKRGIDPNTALAVARSEGGLNSWNLQSSVVKNGVREPSFGPFQLYKGGGLGNEFMSKTGLDPALAANGPAGVDFALDHAAKNGWGAWYGARNTGISNWQGIGTGGAGTAADAVNKLAESAGAATQGLDTLGGGLGKLGQSLTGAFPAAPAAPAQGGGGGLFGWLGNLFSPNLSKYAGLTGLFADGTNYAPGGMAIVGEKGPELVNLPQGSQVFDTNRSARMMGGNDNRGGNQRPQLNVIVQGASGDDHVRELARQGAQEVIYQYNEQQIGGGFGDNQKKYTARVS